MENFREASITFGRNMEKAASIGVFRKEFEESRNKIMEGFSMRNQYPFVTKQSGPSPRKGVYCGHCSSLKPKELRKLDSCTICGKSLYAHKLKKRGSW